MKAWCANFMLYFSFMILTPLLPLYLSEEFGADMDEVGMVLSGYVLMALFIRPFSGFFVDSFPRKVVLLICFFFFFILFGGYMVAGSLMAFFLVRTLHGAPMGAATVSNSTVAIDVLPSERRAEGIGYYGLSNNLATAISPTVGILIYEWYHSFNLIFLLAFVVAGIGFLINCSLHLEKKVPLKRNQPLSLDRFFLLKGWSQGICIACFGCSYSIISTYLAIYGKEELGITTGTGIFFGILSVGLMLSRIVGARTLRQGRVVENASRGVLISLVGYLLFAAVHTTWAYYAAALIIGLGNGHMFPAFQTMFVNLAPNSQRGTANGTLLTSWDVGAGIGIVLGGMVVEFASYGATFWGAWVANAFGVIFFFLHAKKYFIKHKLR